MKEIILPCGCHKIRDDGLFFTCLKQFSKKGLIGIQTVRTQEWTEVKGTETKRGYLQINLHRRVVRINRLVAQNFIPNPECYPESQHKNGIRTDNRVDNLKWGNQKHNADDRERHGNSSHGEKSAMAKLSNKSVIEIREKRKFRTQTLQSLADQFSVSKKLILLVEQRKIWNHI